MMKRTFCLLLAVCMAVFLCACGKGSEKGAENNIPSSDEEASAPAEIIPTPDEQETPDEQQTPEEPEQTQTSADGVNEEVSAPDEIIPTPGERETQDEQQPSEEAEQAQTSADGVDVDLTVLSSTMVYSEVYNMMCTPDDYIGKTVKMEGQFALYQSVDENGTLIPDQIYFACVIADATACCSQGLEFVLAGEHSYPDDYPELGTEITVIGTFQTYEENGYMYCQLVDARMV